MSILDIDKPIDLGELEATFTGRGPYPWTAARDVRILIRQHQEMRAMLKLAFDLSHGVTGADEDDAICRIKVHFETAPTMWLRDAFEQWQRKAEELLK